MFLSLQTREKIQEIIKRISTNQEITLQERIFVENHAKNSSSIWTWLRRANSLRRHGEQNQESINGLIQSLGLDGLERENQFNPKNDDIAEWFIGAPDWVRRS
tara:strand:+ start:1109 stop:1417 length:309 start_codon:yes stop_codon:yes gene_type:complete